MPGQATSRRVTACCSAVSLRLVYPRPLFLHTSAGMNPARSAPGSRGTAVPAVGAECVRTSQPHTAPEGWCQASPSTSCCYSTVGDGPSRPRPRRPSAHTHRRSLPLLQGACSLPSAALQSPPPHTSRPPPGPTLHCVPRPWWFGDSKPGFRISVSADVIDISRPAVPPSRLQTTKAHLLTYASATVPHRAPSPARTEEKGHKYIQQGAAAEPLRVAYVSDF